MDITFLTNYVRVPRFLTKHNKEVKELKNMKVCGRFPLLAWICLLLSVGLVSFSGCPGPGPAVAPGPFIYVANQINQPNQINQINSITAYQPTTSGNIPPFKTYQGASTYLANPSGVALDSNKNLYVANAGANLVTEYAPSNGGNVSPIATIQGSATGLNGLTAITVASNQNGGNIFVANISGNSVTVYAPSELTDRAPFYTVTIGVSKPLGVALNEKLGILWVLNTNPPSITGYKEFGANGNGPFATITFPQIQNPLGLCVDGNGYLYVATGNGNSVAVFNSSLYPGGNYNNATPWALIQGPATGLQVPAGLAVDSNGNLYVANNGYPGNSSITVYQNFSPPGQGPQNSSSPLNLTPDLTIQGPNTQLTNIYALTFG